MILIIYLSTIKKTICYLYYTIYISRKMFKDEIELNNYITQSNSQFLSTVLFEQYKVFRIRTGNVLYLIIARSKEEIMENVEKWLYYYSAVIV